MRVFLDIMLFCAVLYAPLWLVTLIALIGVFLYSHYVEGIIAVFLFDLLYAGGVFVAVLNPVIMLPLVFYALLVFLLSVVVRGQIRRETT